jgi:hypothetical protein
MCGLPLCYITTPPPRRPMTARRLLPLFKYLGLGLGLGLALLVSPACGKDDPVPPRKAPPVDAKLEVLPPVAAGSTGSTTGGTTIIDPFETDGWAEDDTDTEGVATVGVEVGTGDTGEDAPPPLFDGPCYVRWSKGPILRFKYAKDGDSGWLRIDGDNDGNSDVCARFWTKDDRTHKVTVDEGCDKSTDAIISPTYEKDDEDEDANVATATYTDKRGEADAKHEITLITLPAFTGIAPGYPLYAKRDDIDLKINKGLVTRATVKTPLEGPPIKVTLKYNSDGRVTRINEDHEANGKVDRRFDYRYDDVGNVTGMTLTETTLVDGKRKKSKKTAKLGYGCWATK